LVKKTIKPQAYKIKKVPKKIVSAAKRDMRRVLKLLEDF